MVSARDTLIAATADLIRRNGVAGTGVAEILDRSKVARRSIYLHFPGGKSELVAAAARSSGDGLSALLTRCMAEPEPIVAFADRWSQVLIDDDFAGGCPVMAAALARPTSPAAADVAVDVFVEWQRIIATRLTADGLDDAAATSLATTIVATLEGALMLANATRSTQPLHDSAAQLTRLIASYVTD